MRIPKVQSPIIRQIILFGIISAAISLSLALVGFGIAEFYKIKSESIRKLRTQIDILAYNLQPTLLFDDKDAADKILRSVQEDQSISRMRLYKADGKEFTSLSRPNTKAQMRLIKRIYYDKKPIGRLEIDAVRVQMKDRFMTYMWISLLIIIISIPASYFLSAPIRGQVSLAVLQLELQSNRLRMLADQVASTEQSERKRIAAIIHDHLQQILVASKLHLSLAVKGMQKEQYVNAAVSLSRGEEFLNDAIRAAKSLTVELRPPVLYEDGLAAAFQWLANKFKNDHKLDVHLHLDEMPSGLSDNLKIMIFESAKEFLFNVVKYAEVSKADLHLKLENGKILMSVKDQGRGFDVDQAERNSSDKGFGLFSIRERLKLLNGDFKISSYPHHGTEVTITVPVELSSEQMPEEIPASKELATKVKKDKRIKILLADDHKIVREGIANLLKEIPSFNVVAQAENGLEAVEKAESFHPDIVIMDINMPKLNGIEATRIIKNKLSGIDVIGLSVQDEYDVAESMKKAGALTLVNKSGDPQQLVQTILAHVKK